MADEKEAKHVDTTRDYLLSSKLYDNLRFTTQYVIPGLGTFYFTLASIWGLPYAEEVIGTLAALGIFLGVVLGFSNVSYNKSESKYDGELTTNDEGMPRLVVNTPLEDAQGSITLKVPKSPVDGGSQQ